MKRSILIFAITGVLAVGALFFAFSGPRDGSDSVAVKLPQLSTTARAGSLLFSENCADCHGENASGTENGPPLIHKYYEPNHHGDGAFYLAVRQGVRAHHWQFGNMPPVEGLEEEDIGHIVAFVREVQRANGIN